MQSNNWSTIQRYQGVAFCNPDSPINISYIDDEGNELVLYHNQTFNPEKNTKYILKFSLSDAITNGGISANLAEEGEMEEKDFQL